MHILKLIFFYFWPKIIPNPSEYTSFCNNCVDGNSDFYMIRKGYSEKPTNRWILYICFPELMNTIRTSMNIIDDYHNEIIPIDIFDYCRPFDNVVREFDRIGNKHFLGFNATDIIALHAPYLFAALMSFSYKFHSMEDFIGLPKCRADISGTPIRIKNMAYNDRYSISS